MISLICGPMFSGKTTEMIRTVNKYALIGKKCIYLKHSSDTRYEKDELSEVITHDGESKRAVACDNISDVINEDFLEKYDVIGIDEGQFFNDLLSACNKLREKNKIVVVSALSGNFERKMFTPIIELIPNSDKVTFLTAVCLNCGKDAPYNKFKNKNDQNTTFEPIIGGSEIFESTCNSCW